MASRATPPREREMMSRPLTGVRILDLTRLLPGPYATMVLADLGAEVIKIEEPTRGDPARHLPPLWGDAGTLFLIVNRQKKSLTLNLKEPAGVRIFHRLAETADVIVEGFRPGTTERLGIGYATIEKLNPRIIYCSITGYGQTGPYSQRAGHDINYIALAGVLGLITDERGEPVVPGVLMADLGGALVATIAILAALVARQTQGRGQYIDVSLYQAAFAFALVGLASVVAGEELPVGAKHALSGRFPWYNVYRTRDGKYLAVGALEPAVWQRLCQALDRRDLLDKQFTDAAAVRRDLQTLFLSKSCAEWMEQLSAHDVCVEPVLSVSEAMSHPQAQQMLTDVHQPNGRALRQPTPFYRSSAMPAVVERGAPRLGQDTEAILRTLGYSEHEVACLHQEGIV
jgi:crotonobetainyl-CoA:carnitine CoA-transferase CaiB-like acyl-CoA transferase